MIRDILNRFAFVIFYALLLAIMAYSGLVIIELAFKELAR